MFIFGIDPHKESHTAAVLDRTETVIGELRVGADRRQRDRLLEFAADFTPRTWAIESASGLGALLAQQLVAAGEAVLDVPPTLSARVRLLDAGCTDKTYVYGAPRPALLAAWNFLPSTARGHAARTRQPRRDVAGARASR